MRSTARAALVAALAAACLLPSSAAAAGPQALPVVELISVTVTPVATLDLTGSAGSGSLGTTTVVDSRTGSLGYLVSVSSDGFDLVGAVLSSDPVTHIPPASASVAVASASGGTATSAGPVALSALSPVFELTYPSAVGLLPLTTSYALSMTLTVPEDAAPGLYSGTVTQTVV